MNDALKQFVITVWLLCGTSLVLAEDVLAPAAQVFADRNTPSVPDFQKHVIPLLGRLGCNSAKCHGSFQGQGDLRLSLFGFDFKSDHKALLAQATSDDGRRLNPADPEHSLVVLKPTEETDHEGGKRFEIGSWEHHLLLRWIESGARNGSAAGEGADATNPQSQEDNSLVERPEETFFRETIQPIFEDHCYECHGFDARKGGLSVTTRDGLLSGGNSGPAIKPGKPKESLLLDAVSYANDDLQMPPSGKLSGDKIAALKQWVANGAAWPEEPLNAPGETDQVLVELHYEPQEILFQGSDLPSADSSADFAERAASNPNEAGTANGHERRSKRKQQIKVIAEWDDGSREDVTCLARFQTNNDAVARVSRDGMVTAVGEGDTNVIAFYDNGVAAIPVLNVGRSIVPSNRKRLGRQRLGRQPIDRFVNARLDKLGVTPSETCTDAEFLRRLSIDMTGTLPTPDEVVSFLSDTSAKKRTKKIDELLERPAYAAWWTNKLCDFTGCNPKSISSLLEVAREDGYVKASEWYDWVFERVERNEPYDRLVAGLMLADLSGTGRVDRSADGAMPYFWTRQSLKEPKDTAMSVAHAFLGIQLQCAECHKHPFDRWTQADFNDFAQFFRDVRRGRMTVAASDGTRQLRLLRSHTVELTPGDDPRKPIMDWMRNPKNPWFARAFVNRVWAGYFSRGIVEPPDQFTPANPASHPKLLDWLANEFVESGYDMKWLHRQIANSDAYQRSWKPNGTNRTDRRNFSRSIPRRIPAEVVYDAMKQATAGTSEQDAVRANLRRRASGHLSMRMAGTHAMKVFGKPDRSINCDCERVNEPTLLQAIFTQNDPLVRMRIADSGWIIEIEDLEAEGMQIDHQALVKQTWLRTVGRLPKNEERERAMSHLAASKSVSQGIGDLLWAMMNTKEFMLNH